MNQFGFTRVTVASPVVRVGNPQRNTDEILTFLLNVATYSDIVAFPELCLSGYTCADLFRQTKLLDEVQIGIGRIREYSEKNREQLIIVGAPIAVENELFNCAVVIAHGLVIGVVPKQNIPNYNEFYESRWFRPGNGDEPEMIALRQNCYVPFGTDLLFKTYSGIVVGVEICEDLWMPIPPSSLMALAGANILVNLSASNETVAKNDYRTQLVANQSGRCVAAYLYASAGPSESTTDLVFGGHCLIAENGTILAETNRVGDGSMNFGSKAATIDIDYEKLQNERRLLTSFGDSVGSISNKKWRHCSWQARQKMNGLKRVVNGRPFVPSDPTKLKNRCTEIFEIQVASLIKRLGNLPDTPHVHIGVSGGLDSTLALLATVTAFDHFGVPRKNIHGYTMPGFGTTSKTKNNALELMTKLKISQETIDIREMCLQAFKDIKHDPFELGMFHPSCELDKFTVKCLEDALANIDSNDPRLAKGDLTFENVQARMRTFILMSKGFVIGTGDMSELALGWCTYNGDHMSMYNVNCSIPKTLVQFLVRYVASNEDRFAVVREVLNSIADTTISPELLPPGKDGEIVQSTEEVLGPYELHDFFLINFVRYGFSPEKILFLAEHAKFTQKFSAEFIKATLVKFISRFFGQQFKRTCVPDGPKVGSVSLSPRGDWRMPSDADAAIWLQKLTETKNA
jgi:NAD+ synthase (glutamine-hydrolysing)